MIGEVRVNHEGFYITIKKSINPTEWGYMYYCSVFYDHDPGDEIGGWVKNQAEFKEWVEALQALLS